MFSDRLYAEVYDLATNPGALTNIGQSLADEMGYRFGMVALKRDGIPVELSLNQPPQITAAYAEHYFKIDPWTPLSHKTRWGEITAVVDEDDRQFYDSEFYVDFAKPMGVVDPIAIRLPKSTGLELVVAFNQSQHSHRPTDEDGARLSHMARHLQRAFQLRDSFRGVLGERDSLLSALDRVEFGMAITSADGRVHALNQAAEAAIARGCGLWVHGGVLTALDAGMAAPVAMTIRDACNGGSGGALRLPAGESGMANVLVSPLPPQANWPQAGSRALVAFRVPSAPSFLDARLLMAVFGLSRVEAQVAIGIMDGFSIEEIAARRGVKPSTVKTQLDAIFAKTDTTSQRGLIRLLGALPPLRVG